VARLMGKYKVSCPPPSLLETTPEVSSRLVLNRLPPGGLEVTSLGATEGVNPASSTFVGHSFRSEPSSAAVTGMESFPKGESSRSQVFPVFSSRTPASKAFSFPSLPTPDLGFPADPAPSSGPVFKFTPFGMLQIPKIYYAPPSLWSSCFGREAAFSPPHGGF
jgi:hypothetical protein